MSDILNYSFFGKKVLVTGGGRGLGKTIVSRLLQSGATVYTIDKDESHIEDLEREFPTIIAKVADVTKWNETQKVIESFGPMDHLVNNAGNCVPQQFLEVTEDNFDLISSVNLKGLFCVTQAVAIGMIKGEMKGCTIVNISSLAGVLPISPQTSVYSSTKAAVNMLTKSLALELGAHSIRINSISPTAINTMLHDEVVEAITSGNKSCLYRAPLKGRSYALEADEVVNSILFMLSPLSSNMNGHNLILDGGISIC